METLHIVVLGLHVCTVRALPNQFLLRSLNFRANISLLTWTGWKEVSNPAFVCGKKQKTKTVFTSLTFHFQLSQLYIKGLASTESSDTFSCPFTNTKAHALTHTCPYRCCFACCLNRFLWKFMLWPFYKHNTVKIICYSCLILQYTGWYHFHCEFPMELLLELDWYLTLQKTEHTRNASLCVQTRHSFLQHSSPPISGTTPLLRWRGLLCCTRVGSEDQCPILEHGYLTWTSVPPGSIQCYVYQACNSLFDGMQTDMKSRITQPRTLLQLLELTMTTDTSQTDSKGLSVHKGLLAAL